MKAIVQDRYGGPEVLELRDIDPPVPGEGELLLRVRAAGVDPGVWHLMTGLPYVIRLGFGFRAPRTCVRGLDVAGHVEAVGRNVTRFRSGDPVFGVCDGAFAEYACTRETRVVPKPSRLSFEQAAAVPVSAITALQALRDAGRVRPGQKVLIIGAAGGVGTFAVQLAKALGADVTGVCSTTKVELIRSIGADDVIDYTRSEFADGGRRYDLILDTAGNRSLSHLRRALAPRGTLVLVGGEGGGPWLAGLDRQLRAFLLSPLVGQNLRAFFAGGGKEDLDYLRGLLEEGTLTPVIDRTYPLAQTPEAIRYLANGHARGKIVITL